MAHLTQNLETFHPVNTALRFKKDQNRKAPFFQGLGPTFIICFFSNKYSKI